MALLLYKVTKRTNSFAFLNNMSKRAISKSNENLNVLSIPSVS